ncbi:bifunctional DNA primase/polymerase [Pseudooceanicola sp. LIPI14-2-Ac024]|uniref:bifunctional DNA primase/polymerase n=1 Tax=Pseudooceanicola sp. LIPI14-2-Ac024 TaxID=3344875 RepID=UPI0035D118BE
MTEHPVRLSDSMSTPAGAAMEYVKLGWEPLRLPPLKKSPAGKWKEPREWTEAKIQAAFSDDSNVGIALGERSSGLVDIDFDCREAAELAKILLRDYPSFGRPSSPHSHRVIQAELKKGRYTFELPKEAAVKLGAARAMLLEVRGDGHQTMFPPSTHPSGEKVQWHIGAISAPLVEPEELLKLCGVIATLSVVSMAYPNIAGERDEIAMMLAGVLVRAGFEDELIDDLIECVATLGGDEEAHKRRGKSSATRARIDAGKGTWGLPELCSRLGIEEAEPAMRKWLGSEGAAKRGVRSDRPVIFIRGGNLPAEVDEAEAALLAAGLGVYQRGESLVRVVRLPHSEGDDGVKRPSGALLIHPVSVAWLREKFAISAVWMKHGKEEPYPINPPTEHARALLARVGEWRAPVLRGVVSCPTMRADGTILQEPGYDAASGLLYDPGGVVFPQVPETPTLADAQEAMRILKKPFREYQLPTSADWSVLLAAVVTSVIRRVLPSSPLFAIDAPTAGSGKTLMCEAVGVIASGYKPTIISQGKRRRKTKSAWRAS